MFVKKTVYFCFKAIDNERHQDGAITVYTWVDKLLQIWDLNLKDIFCFRKCIWNTNLFWKTYCDLFLFQDFLIYWLKTIMLTWTNAHEALRLAL